MVVDLHYEVLLADGLVVVDGANAYAPDGQMTTFYRCRDDRETIDAWSTRVASFRTADVRRVVRVEPNATRRVAAVPLSRYVADNASHEPVHRVELVG